MEVDEWVAGGRRIDGDGRNRKLGGVCDSLCAGIGTDLYGQVQPSRLRLVQSSTGIAGYYQVPSK